MRKRLLLLFLCAVTASTTIFSQTTYQWTGAVSTVWNVAGNWSSSPGGNPRTTPAASDILVFDNVTVSVTGVPYETIGQLVLQNNAAVTVSGSTSSTTVPDGGTNIARTLTAITGTATHFDTYFQVGDFVYTNTTNISQITSITSATAMTTAESGTITATANYRRPAQLRITGSTGLSISANSSLTLSSTSPFVISLATGAKGTVAGTLVLSTAAQRLVVTDGGNALTFQTGSSCSVAGTHSGNPFGLVPASTNDNILFQAGSSYTHASAASTPPFGPGQSAAAIPASIVNFAKGSTVTFNAAFTTSSVNNFFNSRVYPNVVIGNNTSITVDGAFYGMDTLTIQNGSTLLLPTNGTYPVTGNIVNNGTLGLTGTPTTSNLLLVGTLPQTVDGTGTFNTLGSFLVGALSNATINRSLSITGTGVSSIVGQLNIGTSIISGTGPFQLRGAVAPSYTANTTTGSYTVTNVSNFSNISAGTVVTGPGIQANTIIIATNSGTFTYTISKPATATATAVSLVSAGYAATLVTSSTSGIDGNITTSGTKSYSAGTNYVFNAATTTPFPAAGSSVTATNVTVNANVTLNKVLTVTGALTVTASTLSTGGNLILASNSNGTARIANSTGSITGNVTVQRYIPAGKRGFRFLSPGVTTSNFIKANWQEGATTSVADPSPLFGTHITGSTVDQTNGFDGTLTGNASLFQFNNAAQLWNTGIANTNATNLLVGNAYRVLIRGNRSFDLTTTSATNTATTLRATGTVLTGTVTMNSSGIGATAGMPLLAANADEYSLIGNPYASPVSWTSLNAASTDLTGYYYIWDPTLSTRGAYVSCFTDGTKNDPLSNVTTDIQPGQAVFVKNKSTITTGASLVFQEAYKTAGNTTVFRTQEADRTKLTVQLFLSSNLAANNSQDAVTAIFSNSYYSNVVDDNDAGKMVNLDENIAIQKGSSLMSIEQRNLPVDADTVQLKTWQMTQNNYTLRVTGNNFNANTNAFLKDSYLNTETPLNLNGATDIGFAITADAASNASNRFAIVFRSSGVLPVSISGIKAYQKNTGIQVDWNVANEINLDSYEIEKSINGTSFVKSGNQKAIGSSSYNWFDANPNIGNNFYRIKSISKNGTAQYSQVVNVKIGNGKNSFSIIANPVIGNTILLQMENVDKGNYTLKLFNQAGQLINNSTINHAGGSATEAININNVAKGVYQLIINGNNGLAGTKTVIIN